MFNIDVIGVLEEEEKENRVEVIYKGGNWLRIF